jgi:hypothetical protein
MLKTYDGCRRVVFLFVCSLVFICLLSTGVLSGTGLIGLSSANETTQNQSNTSVNFNNQTISGSHVVVQSVTLPSSGFVVLDLSGAGDTGVLEEDAVAVSKQLPAGTHQNITIPVNHSPPGGVANQTTLNNTGTYEALLYHDSNNNSRFEFITSGRSTDRPFIVGAGSNAHLASDGARIIVRGSRGDPNATPMPTASIRFTDQRTTGSVTVRSVTLPQGGFIAVHNQSYLYGGDPTQTAIGISRYLPAGTHQNVSVALVNGSVQQSQTLIAIPSQDTDNNQTYDYVRSDGFRDVPYTASNGAVTDRAAVTIASSATPTASPSSPITPAAATNTPQPATASTDTARPATGDAAGSGESATQWLTANWIIVLVAIVVIVVVGGYLVRRS